MKKQATKAKPTKDLHLRKGADVKGGGTKSTATTTKPSAFEVKDWSFDVQQSG
jgi:hypothetical protein